MTVPPVTGPPVAAPATATTRPVLIVGALGFMGKFVAESSLAAGHPTFLLVRGEPLDATKAALVRSFRKKGATIVDGSMNEKEVMEKILKENEIEIVISVVGGSGSFLDQIPLVDAMKSVKTIKRFLPSEFGHDVDRADPVEPGLRMYEEKRKVRRKIEEAGIPYTYICCNSIASWPYHDDCHPATPPPLDVMPIYGDGTVKAYFVDGADIGKFTIKAADDHRTLNKNVHFRPPNNYYCINELASLWESIIGRKIPRVTVSEDDLLAAAAENRFPESIVASFTHDIFIKGCQLNFPAEGPGDIDIGTLYPDETFRSLEDSYEDFARMVRDDDKIHIEKSL
ncbi:hypothetical protein K1719_027941 [Acacia pycnantha]|nr:hypothetical protein K1719_027941 [Acacia pycnantha]